MALNMAEIEFKTNEMLGFCSLWVDTLISSRENTETVFSTFENPNIKELANAIPNSFNGLSKTLGDLERNILSGEVKNIDDFLGAIAQSFENNGAEKIEPALRKSFEAYHGFFEKSQTKETINDNLTAVRNLQKDENLGYLKELENLYTFFDVSADKKCVCYLNPYPEKPLNDGSAIGGSFKQNFSVKKLEENSAYIDNSTVLARKVSTPLHEATHFLFAQSEIKQDFLNGKGGGIESFRQVLGEQLEKYPDKRGGNATFDEALASCSSAIITEKRQGKLADNHEWYHNFEAANKIAPHVYPLYKEYISQGKKMDDAFFGRLAANVKEAEREKNKHQCVASTQISKVPDYLMSVKNRLAQKNETEKSLKKINPAELKVDWKAMPPKPRQSNEM